MGYTGFERLWLFFAFSFFGWVLETVTAAVRQRLPGTAWNLAVSRQYDLFDPGGVDRWPCDREDVP